jgi:beta-galactosidase/beta-glucuronidase
VALGVAASAPAQTATETQLLTGVGKDDPVTWDFFCTGGRNSGSWTTIGVPSCWELQGFGTYNYGNESLASQSSEQGLYKRTFTVPAAWSGRNVQLVFEGSMTDTTVKINGVSAGTMHQGAFTQFRYNVTSLLTYGASNLIEVTVAKKSSNASVNDAERTADYWIFGGIFRPVYLECRPVESIQRVAIDAKASGAFSVRAALNGISTADTLTGRILTLDGQQVGASFSVSLAGAPATATLSTTASGITPWNPEKPSLYQLVLELRQGATLLHTITQQFGFRTVEVRTGDGIYVNGVKIRLKGVNRHTFWPTSGRTSSPALAAQAIDLIRGLNMNAVRMSHYPPDQYFLDQCDAAGLMVLDEVPGWQGAYDNAVAPRIVQEVVQRDVNHPSIILWDNGNEEGWNTTVDASFAPYDPQGRTVLHPGPSSAYTFNGVNARHYPTYSDIQSSLAGSDIVLPTEFLHGLYDGGIG